jgi:endonuclease/exonuclease/phosphatase (EEP) superfamily protein YafD
MDNVNAKSWFARFAKSLLTAVVAIANVVAVSVLLLSAFAGNYAPTEFHILGVVPMLLPIAAAVVLLLLMIDLIAWRKLAIFTAICFVVSLPAILDVFPLHLPQRALNGEEQQRAWTLLSYNNYQNQDITGEYPGNINPYATFILNTDADVVCLQENAQFGPNEKFHFTQAQVDSITDRYPYVILTGKALCLLSKFKVEPIDLGIKDTKHAKCDMAAYRLFIGDKRVTLFNVHLRSFGLTDGEKSLYHDLTEFKSKRRINEARHELLGKLASAAADRALQADSLVRFIKHFGGPNVVVCGDFNDVPGCYTLRQLEKQDFKDVFGSIGNGYINTYNANRFYFCIDHILWRGNFKPRSFDCFKLPISDHYPLLTTFVWD